MTKFPQIASVTALLLLLIAMSLSTVGQEIEMLPKGVTFASLLRQGPKKIEGLRIGDVTPNEIAGFEFLRVGKLRGLRLGISTEADVIKILGKACDEGCRLDGKWRLWINYYPAKSTTTKTTETDGVKTRIQVQAKPEFIGRIESIAVIPNKSVHLSSSAFSNEFYRGHSVIFSHAFSVNDKKVAPVNVFTTEYLDGYGLIYSLEEKDPLDEPTAKHPKVGKLRRVTYKIPSYLEEQEIFIYLPVPPELRIP